MIAETERKNTRICKECWSRLPITEFRHVSRAKGTYHRECRDCRRTLDQKQKTKQRSHVVTDSLRRIRRAQTVQQMVNLVEAIASELGGIEQVANEFVERAQTDDPGKRFKATQTLLFMFAVADLAKAEAGPKLDDPEKVIRELHRTHRLFPTLRDLYSEGKLSFDDIDPPPVAEV